MKQATMVIIIAILTTFLITIVKSPDPMPPASPPDAIYTNKIALRMECIYTGGGFTRCKNWEVVCYNTQCFPIGISTRRVK